MIGALAISAAIAYFYALPFAAVLQGANYRVKGYLARAEKYILLSSLYFFLFSAMILSVEWLWHSSWRYLLYFFTYALTTGMLFLLKGGMDVPIVGTKRFMRLLIAAILLYLLCFFALLFGRGAHLLAVTPALSPVILPIAATMIAPFEKRNNERYILAAKEKIANSGATIIGITGSYGKTSVKNDLEQLLSRKYAVLASPANYNTPLGIAKTMQGATGREEILLFEMGARRAGDVRELCEMTSPTIGVITGIAPQHLETFGSVEEIVKEKERLVYAIPEGGKVFFNLTDPQVREMYARFSGNKVGVGKSDADYLIADTKVDGTGVRFRLLRGEESLEISLPSGGKAGVVDFALSAAVAWELGVEPREISEVGKLHFSAPHRFEVMRQGEVTIIDDSYNINPVGAESALESLSLFPAERRIVYCSGMVELGSEEIDRNRRLGEQIAEVADEVILGGGKYGEMVAAGLWAADYPSEKVRRVKDTAEASEVFRMILRKGDVLLIMSDLPRDYLL